ncbi:MAG: tripartite tricarboxylate transporter TctB family protein [Spirochaetales bacterium]
MSKVNIVYGGITALLGAIFLISTFTFYSEQRGLDPRVYPRVICIAMLVLSIGLIVSGLKGRKKVDSSRNTDPGEDRTAPRRMQRIGWMFLVSLAYVAILEKAGYILSTPPFIAISMVFFGERKVSRILLVSFLTSVFLFWLFRGIFRVPLPMPIFW